VYDKTPCCSVTDSKYFTEGFAELQKPPKSFAEGFAVLQTLSKSFVEGFVAPQTPPKSFAEGFAELQKPPKCFCKGVCKAANPIEKFCKGVCDAANTFEMFFGGVCDAANTFATGVRQKSFDCPTQTKSKAKFGTRLSTMGFLSYTLLFLPVFVVEKKKVFLHRKKRGNYISRTGT
jgi:hypothetical protein